jgi:hypothetical protein
MNNKTNATIAALESKIDMLETELSYLNQILIQCGFSEGIDTLKISIEEMLLEDSSAKKVQEI